MSVAAATSPPPTPTAIVIDDTVMIREGLPLLVDGHLRVVAAHGSIEPVLRERPEVDLIILDLHLNTPTGIRPRQGRAAIKALVGAGYRVCLYTDERRRFVLAACLQAGAHGIVHKTDPTADAIDAFQQVAAGETVITRSIVGLAELLDRGGKLPDLTPRQRQMLSARARGEAWGSICGRLHISQGTATDHYNALTKKIGHYFTSTSPGDIERDLGLAPGDLFDD